MKVKESNSQRWILVPVVLFAVIGVFARVMTSFNHNEHMYMAASIFVSQGKDLYKDFAYLQAPYLPLFYGALINIFNISSHYLLLAKFLNIFFVYSSSILLLAITQKILRRGRILSVIIATMFLFNRTIINASDEISNYIMPVFFSLACFYVFIHALSVKKKYLYFAISGLLLAIAIGTRLTYLPIIVPFLATIIFYTFSSVEISEGKQWKNLAIILLAFFTGVTIGLLPIIFFFFSGPSSFLFNNLEYHLTNTQWRQITGFTKRMSMFSKLSYARKIFFRADNLVLLFSLFFGLGFSHLIVDDIRHIIKNVSSGFILALLLVLFALAITLIPTPSWLQYYAMPVSFLFILLIYSNSYKIKISSAVQQRIFLILLMFQIVYIGPLMLLHIVKLPKRDAWKGVYVHDTSENIKDALKENLIKFEDGKVATLDPIFALEANIPIYPQFSTGTFLYRVGDLLTDQQKDQYVSTSPQVVTDLLERDPPIAVLVGYGHDPLKADLDRPLLEYAINNNYKKVEISDFIGYLYVRP